ncbi:phospholipase A2 inhibitor and Ly6/PLAUR domain-containing protein-like [Hyperolius riggenbachi]|uniref:phospholipase A2 inhibitor and Ly6/PLAUR domain-containing protein-like n=1 Tax=Hyperolius riggenbachi TaxID=752182 RepID=UPI0035A2829F
MKSFPKRQHPLKAEMDIPQQPHCPMDGKVQMYRTSTIHRTYAIVFLSIMAALWSQGYSIRCFKCSGSSPDCNASLIQCKPQYDACNTKLDLLTIKNESDDPYFSRSCAQSQYCGWSISTSFGSASTLEQSSCCMSDNCTPAIRNISFNGLKCPTKYSPPNLYPQGIESCRGDQNLCFNFTNTQTTGNTTVQVNILGCANEQFCRNFRFTSPTFLEGNVSCVDATAELV